MKINAPELHFNDESMVEEPIADSVNPIHQDVCVRNNFYPSYIRPSVLITMKDTSPTDRPTAGISSSISESAAEESFQSFYLRKVAEELAEDLDKARSASDFSERSLPILIQALQQGIGVFSKEERIRIGRVTAAKDGN